ncbi:MAG: acetyl-CoA carboxylase carboxyltransferase subunit alpha [Phycisphaerales bacterium]|nr:MAG: acetyl-CoA carboxylase carboxyltransferase subunit alpha [Phycisphaerales bacterium]
MALPHVLECEKPLHELERKIQALESLTSNDADQSALDAARAEYAEALAHLYANLSPWDIVRVARHPKRPQTRDYIRLICKDFCELHGDRRFGDDPALITGFARIGSMRVMIVGHHKGADTNDKIACHFGCAHPEGYRKALAKMRLAEKFGLPIVTLVDTPGAFPGLGAEQRGQAEAIAVNMLEMSRMKTPIVSIVIGEGGSGGALGIAVADRVAMLEYAYYSVISPEGCAAILWKEANSETNSAAAKALKLTAKDNLELGIVDDVITEPVGGAHRDPAAMGRTLEQWITDRLRELNRFKPANLPARRYERFRKLGSYLEVEPTPEPSEDAAAPSPAPPAPETDATTPRAAQGNGAAARKPRTRSSEPAPAGN